MLKPKIVYIGDDQNFAQLLYISVSKLGIPCQRISSDKINEISPQEAVLAIIDEDISASIFTENATAFQDRNIILILALTPQNPASAAPGKNLSENFDDVIEKSLTQKHLDKRISFFVNCLRIKLQVLGQIDAEKVTEQNRRLNEEIAELQKKMSQIGSDLYVQGEVLNKITQIRQLSRQINCLDLERIASVCIEQIPQLISARFSSIYQYDANKQFLHLLRHSL